MELSCKAFKVGKCEGQKIVDGEAMPLVLEPPASSKNDLESLLLALQNNKDWFEKMIIKNSAVLLRGFDVKNAEDFNQIIEACGWEDIRYIGPAPRTHIYKRVWTANEGPLSEFIYYHHEMVLFKDHPKKLMLFCEVPPREGGETPFVPSFKVTEKMLEEFPEAVEEMEKKGLQYSFTALSKRLLRVIHPPREVEAGKMLLVPLIEKKLREALGMDLEGLPNGGVKTIIGPRSLTRVFDGRKGRRMWFNTVVGMHVKDLSSATMADGTEIPSKVVKRCGEIIEEESIQFKWQKGDVLFFDNLVLLHGRRPSLPPRRVLVATCK